MIMTEVLLMSDTKFERNAGILMPVSSLPSPYGIGTFGKDAYDLLHLLKNVIISTGRYFR